uniref:EOG090X0KP6 n=1 Tax=Moina brachiata TaxID=675436 RepID=A0A4Y7NJH8_9CRUS|nr:EOG090X0KP6 [Moina brachiata]SVE93398.1 EOG090X0KP6 [Moina brachiata]
MMGDIPLSKSIFSLESDDEGNSVGDSAIPSSLGTFQCSDATNSNSDISSCNDGSFDAQESHVDQETDKQNPDSSNVSAKDQCTLTAFQKAKIERNRQKALLLRQARLKAHPYKNSNIEEHSVIRVQNSRLIDSGGGFLIDEKDLIEEQSKEVVITEVPAPIILPERPHCEECDQPIHDSFLYHSFSSPVCDTCRDNEEKHALITRTDAKREYLLKDCDLDLREPILRFILRKNPHNPRWGDMKLYLRSQIEKRALEIWETPDKLEEERDLRDNKREKTKINKFNKEVKALRMAVRSSVYKKQTTSHEHTFGAEQYDADEDIYFKICSSCSHRQEYEKM